MNKLSLTLLLLLTCIRVFGYKENNGFTKPIDAQLLTELNPERFNTNFNAYDQNTALFCSQISDLAYVAVASNVYDIEDTLRKLHPGYDINIDIINNPFRNIQVVLFATNRFVIVAFRGTEFNKIRDIISDVKISPMENTTELAEHYGFLPAGQAGFRGRIMNLIDEDAIFYRIEKMVRQYGKKKGDMPIYLTGHSLGAAMASMFVTPLKNKGFSFKGSYHFAPPLTVSCADAIAIKNADSSVIYDIVNYKDEVAKGLGLSAIYSSLKHIGKFYRICENGYINNENEIVMALTAAEKARGLSLTIKMHRLASYQEAIRNSNNSVELINARKLSGARCFPGNDYTPLKCW